MKRIEFETSKGKFLLMDGVGEDFAMDLTHKIISEEWFVLFSEITEEQASEIVGTMEERLLGDDSSEYFKTAIKSLHSLLKSKGVHLYKNPYDGVLGLEFPLAKHKTDKKTFYNPYIFKI